MAGIVTRLPFSLSGRTASAASATYALTDYAFDVAIAGLPFLLAVSEERPLIRAGAPIRKEQFDNQQIPGEQSLANWWLRSQSTFIGGAGILYQDPASDNQYAIRFAESQGVNPWTNGSLTLLRSTSERIADASADTHHVAGWSDGTDRYWSAVGAVLKSDDGTTATTITWGGAATIRSLASDGTNYYAASNEFIYQGAGSGAGAAWGAATGTTDVVVRWVKGRVMVGLGHQVYDTDAAGVRTLRFTHLNTSWVWTDFAEGTNAIFASGHAGAQSDIYKFTLEADGATPTLASGGVLAAQLPLGEVVNCLTAYLGTFVGIGTSRGFRVGQIDDNGDIQYGPLLIENSEGVHAVAAFDRFFFVGASNAIDGSSGLYRVDLGQPLTPGDISPGVRFAYATDLQAGETGRVTSVTNFGTSDRMVFAVTGQGAYLESATEKVATGTLTTGRIRYNTLEPKIFKFVSVKTPDSQFGTTGVSVLDPGGGDTSVVTVSEGGSVMIENVILTAVTSAVEWIALKFTLSRSASDTAEGGQVDGWQLKAMPGATRQRVFTIPLACFDREKDKAGQHFGFEGYAKQRLEALEAHFQRGDAVSFQNLAGGSTDLVVIDDYEFRQTVPPARNRTTYGGFIFLKLRTIADVTTL